MKGGDGSAVDRPGPLEPGRVARGAAWATVEVWGVELLHLLFFTVLARLIGPEGYGLVALAMAFVMVPQNLLVHGGWIEALVQRPTLVREHVDSTFWLLAGLGLASMLGLLLLAGAAEAWLSTPALGSLLSALSVCPFLTSLMVVPAGLLQRRIATGDGQARNVLVRPPRTGRR